MKKIITEAQMQEIEKLAENHHEAIIAAMADMYRRGLIWGMVVGGVGAVGWFAIEYAYRCMKTKKNAKSEKES